MTPTGKKGRRGEEPEMESQPWLELRGTLEEPVKGVQDVVISMYPRDKLEVGTAKPASVGATIGMKPRMEIVLTWSHVEFDRARTLVLSGALKHGYLHFTTPHYSSGLVVSASFSNECGVAFCSGLCSALPSRRSVRFGAGFLLTPRLPFENMACRC